MEVWMSVVDDALADLDSGVAEVAQEIAELADRVEAGELNQDQIASEIRMRAQALKDIRPDTPVTDVPADGEPAV
jgi:hypothetical protein